MFLWNRILAENRPTVVLSALDQDRGEYLIQHTVQKCDCNNNNISESLSFFIRLITGFTHDGHLHLLFSKFVGTKALFEFLYAFVHHQAPLSPLDEPRDGTRILYTCYLVWSFSSHKHTFQSFVGRVLRKNRFDFKFQSSIFYSREIISRASFKKSLRI